MGFVLVIPIRLDIGKPGREDPRGLDPPPVDAGFKRSDCNKGIYMTL